MLNILNHTMKIAEHCDDLIKQTQGRLCPKQDYLRILVLHRAIIRGMLSTYNQAVEEWRYYERHKKLMEKQGMFFPLVDVYIQNNSSLARSVQKSIAQMGGYTEALLDTWQQAGATREELYNLCGFKGSIDAPPETRFSKLVFVHNLDYPDNGDDFIDMRTDAPLTHAVKELWLDRMTNTEAGRQAAHNAFEAVFPDIMENAMAVRENEDGVKCLYDHNGELIGPLEGELT